MASKYKRVRVGREQDEGWDDRRKERAVEHKLPTTRRRRGWQSHRKRRVDMKGVAGHDEVTGERVCV